MDALTRCFTVAPLLWPNCDPAAFDVRLSRGDAAITATLLAGAVPVAVVSAADGTAALDALAATLAGTARDRSYVLLRAAGVPAPARLAADDASSPVPARDELAARLAEAERELADVTVRADAMRHAVHGLALRGVPHAAFAAIEDHGDSATADAFRTLASRLAARVDPQPAQRAPGVVAGVSADVVDAWCNRLNHALRGAPHDVAGEVVSVVSAMRAEARQRAGGGEGRGEAVEQRQAGGGGVGAVAQGAGVERVVVLASAILEPVDLLWGRAVLMSSHADRLLSLDVPRDERLDALRELAEHGGQRVRLVVEVLRGEGGSVHGDDSVAPATSTGKAHAS